VTWSQATINPGDKGMYPYRATPNDWRAVGTIICFEKNATTFKKLPFHHGCRSHIVTLLALSPFMFLSNVFLDLKINIVKFYSSS
jgi:hypothetical protein